ncbi:nuclease A inhibitor family protein [Paraflavisolibacter sp. H34]|uniref:nuclease A inhibitor family protein n=1 Tax=Huijunlia imazamoxiresistens TaxID=3127457 RepID=UPI003019E888
MEATHTSRRSPLLQQLEEAAAGLFFISESDYPFETVFWEEAGPLPEEKLKELAGKGPDAVVEQVTADYFFRNAVTVPPGADPGQQETARRFARLLQVLKEAVSGLVVYRIGRIQVDAFLTGPLADGSGYGGLRTKLVET